MIQNLLNFTVVIFLVGNLLEVGLRLKVEETLAALQNIRFVALTLLWCFILALPLVCY